MLFYRGMLAIRKSIPLLLVVVNFSKAPETPIGATPVTRHIPDVGELSPDSIHPLHQVSLQPVQATDAEIFDVKCATSKGQHSNYGSPSKRPRSNREDAADHKHDDKSKNIKLPPSTEPKSEIVQNLARHKEELTAMKARGEQMKKWFNIVMQREDMLGSYGFVEGGESIRSILQELNGVQRDINWVVQTRLFTWAGLGQEDLYPVEQDEIAPQQEHVHRSSANFESNSDLQPQHHKSSLSVPLELKKSIAVKARQEKTASLVKEAGLSNNMDATNKAEDFEEGLKPQLNGTVLKIIQEYIMEGDFSTLSYILHTTTFHSWTDLTCLKYWEEIRVIKLAFEKSIFQTISFLYKFKLVNRDQLKGFLSCDHILELIGNHLVDLVHVVQDFTYNELAFTPDFEFLKNHPRTDHLQDILEVLGKTQQAHVLSSALTTKIQIYKTFLIGPNDVEWSEILMELIFKQNFFPRLEAKSSGEVFSLDSQSTEVNDLKKMGKRVVDLFQNPFPNSSNLSQIEIEELKKIQAGYILIYQILILIQKHHEEYLRSIFDKKPMEYDFFKKQIKLFEAGFKLKQVLQQGKTYIEIINSSCEEIYTISKDNAKKKLESTKQEYDIISEKYRNMAKDFEETFRIKNNQKGQNWFEGGTSIAKVSLRDFFSDATSWEMGIQSEEIRREYLRSDHKQNKKNEIFQNLNLGDQVVPPLKQRFTLMNKEIMDLWDPMGFYL